MSKRNVIALVNLIISGCIAFMITMFFAGGTIGENYTDETYVAPEFFIILVIWGIGAIFAVIQFFKNLNNLFELSIIVTWISIPLGFTIVYFM